MGAAAKTPGPREKDPPAHSVIGGEYIDSQGLLILVVELDDLLQAAHTLQMHHQPKYLLLHHLGLEVHVCEVGGG